MSYPHDGYGNPYETAPQEGPDYDAEVPGGPGGPGVPGGVPGPQSGQSAHGYYDQGQYYAPAAPEDGSYYYQGGQPYDAYGEPYLAGPGEAEYSHYGSDGEGYGSDFTMPQDPQAAAHGGFYGGARSDSFAGSGVSYDDGRQPSGSSTPMYGLDYASGIDGGRSREPYPAWSSDNQVPISKEEIEDIFIDLTNKFGFQRDSMRNMYDHLMCQLDSRGSRMAPNQALLSLHGDYIGGDNANYKKWYFAAQLDLDDEVGFRNMKLGKTNRKTRKARKKSRKEARDAPPDDPAAIEMTLEELEGDNSLEAAEYRWKVQMSKLTPHDRARQLALYLLMWGEANQTRFMPECLCFLFKCAEDYYRSPQCQNRQEPVPEFDYLNRIVTPLYRFIRAQSYEVVDGRFVKRERDHNKIIGYDDINQLFWYPEGIERIIFEDGTRLVDLPQEERYLRLGEVEWKDVFFKTYKETRSWFHLATNFNRIWVIHFTMYWYYVAFNSPTLYTKGYIQTLNNQPPPQFRWSAAALGGAVATLIQIVATLAEWAFVPRKWAGAQHLTRRLLFLLLIFAVNFGPSVYIFGFIPLNAYSKSGLIVGIIQFFVSIATYIFFAVMPLGGLFGSYLNKKTRRYLSSQTFTASFPRLKGRNMAISYILWLCVFFAKFIESYFFMILSLRDSIRNLSEMTMSRCIGEVWFGQTLCRQQARIVLGLMYVTDLVLFFLDTYLWYIICNCAFSVGLSFSLGISILTPWKNIFTRLPKRIYSKVLATTDMEIKYKPKVLISQVWNAIIISMYREHLLAIDHVQKLLYHQVPSEVEGRRTLRAPTFFVSQDDHSFEAEFFPPNSEAERRISFFAQSLSTPIPEPVPVDNMPTFTVLVPHYSEKILLSLREIIREDDQFSRVTLLEYLKQLHPVEWDCFVKDTKILAEESTGYQDSSDTLEKEDETLKNRIDDLPFYCIGFKSAAPEYTLRTRIWASLRSQTLYRTISGFMNYSRAIKLLYRVENPEIVQMFNGNTEQLERELERMARRKFKLLVSMQRLAKFRPDEMENAEFLLRAYPDLQIAFLDEEPPLNEGEEPRIYSALIDGYCEIMENGRRRPKYRVQLSGNPILGDGKSDNQNHALIFYRGEYIQVIDANQDNYLEECLKIRSILAEFEEMEVDNVSPYVPGVQTQNANPVAIVGAREYIFSENIGVLGDVAAGKEQTFGTLFSRTLATIGGKLHYGHPDFLNAVFMTTRGGISKAQKGLHLNEDIYAGMNALIRGGRIKHCDYFQCGKGRDLGFGSILNFTTKIGAGMGEQMLSREYYYLGTQLPLDRFLSFYYAHPGFHINNLFIMLSVQLFMLTIMNLGSLASQSIICIYDRNKPVTDPQVPRGCYNLQPVLDWVRVFILSIFIVFFISFLPLVVQELTERGVWKAASRFLHHFVSMSPLFEVFVCQIYGSSLMSDMSVGGARYISTGRGFATARIPFSVLYSRFATTSIYLGARTALFLLFATIAMWQAALLWFWVSIVAMCMSPFIFNPHQFAFKDFFIDYRDFIRWLSRGNSKWHRNSWIGYVRIARTRITGFKRKTLGEDSEKAIGDSTKAHFTNVFFTEVFLALISAAACFLAYTFINAQNGVSTSETNPVNSCLRLIICTLGPIVINAGCCGFLMGLACCAGPLLGLCCKQTASVMAGVAHGVAVIVHVIFFEVMWYFQSWDFTGALLGLIASICCERLIFNVMIICCLTREFKHDHANRAFWSGKWYGSGMGWMNITQPGREFLCKIIEMSYFAGDFMLAHWILFVQTPFVFIPYVDKFHSMMLFWLKPSRQIRPPIFSVKQNKLRKRMIRKYATLYFVIMAIFIAMLVGPAVAGKNINNSFVKDLPSFADGLFQPVGLNNNDTGPNAPSYILSGTPSAVTWSTVN